MKKEFLIIFIFIALLIWMLRFGYINTGGNAIYQFDRFSGKIYLVVGIEKYEVKAKN